jgi:DNA-binding response OmpR family regulator
MGNNKILLVDDDPALLLAMELRLKANHFDVFLASDAVTSISEARKHEPDLIILDVVLPAGDGFVVIERLRAVSALATTPIIVISGRDIRGNQERAIKAGVLAFFQKPINNAEVLAVIRQVLGDRVHSDEPLTYDLSQYRGEDTRFSSDALTLQPTRTTTQ